MSETATRVGKPKKQVAGRKLSLWLPDDIYTSIDALADKERRYVGQQIQLMLEQWLERNSAAR